MARPERYDVAAKGPLWTPADHGLLAWSLDLGPLTGTATPANGVPNYIRIPFPEGGLITNICYVVASAGVNGAASLANCFFGVFNEAGTRLGRSADQSTALQSAGFKNPPLVVDGGQSLTIPRSTEGYVWGAFITGTQATTAATLRAGGNSGTTNAGLTATSPFRAGVSGSGLSDLPTSVTVSAMTVGVGTWMAVQ